MDSDLKNIIEDDDEEIVNYIQRSYSVRTRPDHFQNWNNSDFFNRFRLSKPTVNIILHQIRHLLEHRTNRNYAVPPILQLLITLRYYATGDMYIVVGDFGGLHKTTAGKIIKRVTRAIITLRDEYIHMPRNENEIRQAQEEFYNVARFLRVIGAVDGTHIRIFSPGGPDAENFRNRKGLFSFNVQVICNAKYMITDIVARWPGSAHDNTIFDHSAIRARFEVHQYQNSLLLGDSAYALRSFLLTPLANLQIPAENLYNESHIRTRTTVERTFGIWKRRFPVLSIGIRCKLPLIQDVILATAIMHNIARIENEAEPENINDEDIEEYDHNYAQQNRNNTQQELIDYFNSLL